MQKVHAEPGTECPLYKQDMSEVCHKCAFWTGIKGKHPQTDEMLDRWHCAIALLPVLLIDVGRQAMATSVEVNELRNETAVQAEASRAFIERIRTLKVVSHNHGKS